MQAQGQELPEGGVWAASHGVRWNQRPPGSGRIELLVDADKSHFGGECSPPLKRAEERAGGGVEGCRWKGGTVALSVLGVASRVFFPEEGET